MLRAYIAAAKQYEPYVPESLTDYLAAVYAEMRAEEAATDMPHSYTTARTLLSILRLSQSLARLRFADAVEQVGLVRTLGRQLCGSVRTAGRRHPLLLVLVCVYSQPVCPQSKEVATPTGAVMWPTLMPGSLTHPHLPHTCCSLMWMRPCG